MKSSLQAFAVLSALTIAADRVVADVPTHHERPRIVVMTDIGGDPDDRQSLVRFLVYANEFDIEGLCTGFGHGHYEITHPELIRNAIHAYGKVADNLRLHDPRYPAAQDLLDVVKDGDNGDPHSVGPGRDSEASDWIIQVLDRDDPRPVWFSIWGGPRELAQAIWKVSQTRSPDELARFKSKIRVHSIADQDRTAGWIKKNHPDVFWIYSNKLFRGIWNEGDQSLVSPAWLQRNVLQGHGPLGPLYPPKAAGKDGVKEGDTPSFLYVLANGLSDPDRPEWGNWGGRFLPSGYGREFIPTYDLKNGQPDLLYSIHRWRRAYQNAFEARMDWCTQPYSKANHEPIAVCNGDSTRGILQIEANPGEDIRLDATGSSDPDGDGLAYRWWVYQEAGSYWAEAPIQDSQRPVATLKTPREASGRTIHVIIEVEDSGSPPLVAYRRMLIAVSGEPKEPPADVHLGEPDLSKPVTSQSGPSAETGEWTFWRGININGPATVIDGNRWDGDLVPYFTCNHTAVNSPHVALLPPADEARTQMIHSFRWSREVEIKVAQVPAGAYAVYAYLWEETSPETIRIRLNGRMVERDYYTGIAGRWKRLGPWFVDVSDGYIAIESSGGAANFSGIEIWRKSSQPKSR